MTTKRVFSVGGLLFSNIVALSPLFTDAFAPTPLRNSPIHSIPSTISTTLIDSPKEPSTALYNRQARRKQKKKKVRSSAPSFVIDDEEENTDDDEYANASSKSQETILLGGGEIGFSPEVPDSKIPIAEAKGSKKKSRPSKLEQELSGQRISPEDDGGVVGESVTSAASVSDALPLPGGDKPDVSTVITDPETGIQRIQQGKYVMDKVTGKAVVLSSLGPEYRLAQMFPGVPPEIRSQHRFDWSTITVPEMVQRLSDACTVPLKHSDTGATWNDIPPHPQISNPAVDFVLANRDYLGHRMKKTLGRLKLRAQSQFQTEEALRYRKLWKHFLLLEDHISAPFRQMVLDAEGKIGPNFGNLDVASYCGGEVYERTASYLVLKSMVAHWEKKYQDASFLEDPNTPGPVYAPDTEIGFLESLYVGDPKRYLPNPPIIYRLNEVSRIVVMAQKMCKAFVENDALFGDLPPEVKFVEAALSIQGGTALRKFMLEEFCPANNVDPSSLREGLRRLYQQMFQMQIDPYGDLTMTLWNLCVASSVGTEEGERDPYEEYIGNVRGVSYEENPGFFQTYTFDHDEKSLVRFLDTAKKIEKGTAGSSEDIQRQISGEAKQLFNFNFGLPQPDLTEQTPTKQESKRYVVPEDRAIGRPHMMGWLDLLGEDEELMGGEDGGGKGNGEGKGEETAEEVFEADNWVAVEK